MLLFSRVTKISTPPKYAWNQRDSKRFKVLVLYPTTWILLLASHIVPIALRGMICKHRASKLSAPLVLSQTLKNILKMRNMIFFFLLSFSLGHAKWCSKVTAYSELFLSVLRGRFGMWDIKPRAAICKASILYMMMYDVLSL